MIGRICSLWMTRAPGPGVVNSGEHGGGYLRLKQLWIGYQLIQELSLGIIFMILMQQKSMKIFKKNSLKKKIIIGVMNPRKR